MPIKVNIADKGKTWRIEVAHDALIGKSLGETIKGSELSSDLEGYEFMIRGASDIAGFPHKIDVEGSALRRVLLTRGWGMRDNTEGMRRRKTVRGKQISEKTTQLNLNVSKTGSKKLQDIFPDQNKPKEAKAEAPAPAQ